MQKALKINFTNDLVKDLIKMVLVKTPGIDSKKPIKIDLNTDQNKIKLSFSIVEDFLNVYDIATKAQESVCYHMKKEFDLDKLTVDVEVN